MLTRNPKARQAAPLPRIGRSTFVPRDVLAEALAGMLQRPARSALTMLGTVLGVGAFVAVLGLTATASSQIDSRFNVLSATEVTVEDIAREQDEFADAAFPDDASDRVERLNGVRHAGVLWTVQPRQSAAELTVAAAPVGDSTGKSSTSSPPPPVPCWRPSPGCPRAGCTTTSTPTPASVSP